MYTLEVRELLPDNASFCKIRKIGRFQKIIRFKFWVFELENFLIGSKRSVVLLKSGRTSLHRRSRICKKHKAIIFESCFRSVGQPEGYLTKIE